MLEIETDGRHLQHSNDSHCIWPWLKSPIITHSPLLTSLIAFCNFTSSSCPMLGNGNYGNICCVSKNSKANSQRTGFFKVWIGEIRCWCCMIYCGVDVLLSIS